MANSGRATWPYFWTEKTASTWSRWAEIRSSTATWAGWSHDEVIDHSVGGWYRTDRGHTLLAVRPTLADYVLEMPRGPTIIYPKDLGLNREPGRYLPGSHSG